MILQDYEPLDLSRLCNAPFSRLTKLPPPSAGPQSICGIPFTPSRRTPQTPPEVLGFHLNSKSNVTMSIPVGKKATYVIVAHTLLDIKPFERGPIGKVAAHYVVRFAGGRVERIPIRERYEIGVPGCSDPFRAWRGHHAKGASWTYSVCLWYWKNPEPDRAIDAIEIEPVGYPLIVAGITLSHLDEEPLAREARVPVKITLVRPEDAGKVSALQVDMDRGSVTPPRALPAESPDELLGPIRQGWGPSPASSDSVYVEVAGNPSGTISVRTPQEELAQANWGELQRQGKIETPRVQLVMGESGRNWVHVKVLDDATGKPIPCRIHFRSPHGIPYQPYGYHNRLINDRRLNLDGELEMGSTTYAYIDGQCQGWLPRGQVIIDATRGFEYDHLRAMVEIKRDQRELVLRMKRWTHMNEKRWFSGDSHVHYLPTQGAHREAQGEDLNVVNLLQSQWGEMFTNSADFIGRPTVSDDGKTIVYCAQENRQHILGHLNLWGLMKPVMPWCTDGPIEAEANGALEIGMSHWADACHAQGGTVVIPHFPHPNGEPAALVATGRADAVEMIAFSDYLHENYYNYLNCGYRLPLVGGTDKMGVDIPVGLYRTYAHIPDHAFDYEHWCAAVRQGRTFLSSGPMITFKANGAVIGDTLCLPGNGGTIEVEATAESIFPLHTLQIIREGRVVAETEDRQGTRRLNLHAKLSVDRHTWLAARCGGPGYYNVTVSHGSSRHAVFAHTSPIYVAVGGDWWMFNQAFSQYMLTLIDGSCQYVRHAATHYKAGTATHHHGLVDHLSYLEAPFQEAAAAIHRRMHQLGVPH